MGGGGIAANNSLTVLLLNVLSIGGSACIGEKEPGLGDTALFVAGELCGVLLVFSVVALDFFMDSMRIFFANSLVIPEEASLEPGDMTTFLIASCTTCCRICFSCLLARASVDITIRSEISSCPDTTLVQSIGFFGSCKLNRRLRTFSRYSLDSVSLEQYFKNIANSSSQARLLTKPRVCSFSSIPSVSTPLKRLFCRNIRLLSRTLASSARNKESPS
mmetsp:Transcript_24680/g.38771  ORF Transcript_24680/g.38771 Transcript_24680/m.38771 type:complete len:218 (-) Transcript_24680:1336-1989(-)